jgi:hypothetical protein
MLAELKLTIVFERPPQVTYCFGNLPGGHNQSPEGNVLQQQLHTDDADLIAS